MAFVADEPFVASPDLAIIAKQVTVERTKAKRLPSSIDLESAVTGVTITDTIQGSSTLSVRFRDVDWALTDAGFFDVDRDGRLDAIDVNYPVGSRLWWRVTQVGLDASQELELTLMERAAADLLNVRGPTKASRAKVTRAEFLKTLAGRPQKRRIHFHSHDLRTPQKIASEKTKDDKKRDKDAGISKDAKVTVKGAKASSSQISKAETLLSVADDEGASEKVMIALIAAAIGESELGANRGARGTTLQTNEFSEDQLSKQAYYWLHGGKSFRAGGGLGYASEHPDASVGEIASKVEVSDQGASYYDGFADEAREWVDAFGGSTGGYGSYTKQYNFQVGTEDQPHETYWDAMQRLAGEVKWALFLDGQDLYFDPETTLIRQKPTLVIERDDPAVVDWSYTWDGRKIATGMTLDLIVEPFALRAGEVIQLEGFGPASKGSTAKLPGRWLISEIERDLSGLASSLTLKQPTKPGPEPRGETVTREGGAGAGDLVSECKRLSDKTPGYLWGGGHGPKLSTLVSSQGLDCSSSTSLALYRADLFDDTVAWVSRKFASDYGEKGEGDEFTVYANAGHVFIQGRDEDGPWRFDTGGPDGGNGPKLHRNHRPTDGFTPRRWKGKDD